MRASIGGKRRNPVLDTENDNTKPINTAEGSFNDSNSRDMIGGKPYKTFLMELAEKSEITKIALNEEDVLYIYCPVDPGRLKKEQLKTLAEDIRHHFMEYFPGVRISVGFYDLKFTALTKKQEFAGRLKHDINEPK